MYVGGKLTAPPAVSDLNDQIQKLRKAESDLSVSLSKVNTGSFNHPPIPMVDDPDVQAASATFSSYLAEWKTSKTMFEATLGKLIPKWAYEMRPPPPDLTISAQGQISGMPTVAGATKLSSVPPSARAGVVASRNRTFATDSLRTFPVIRREFQ